MSDPHSAPAILAVDIGNTASHFGLAPHGPGPAPPEPSRVLERATPEIVSPPLADFLPDQPLHWLVASVCRPAEMRLRQWVERRRPGDVYQQLTYRDLPLSVQVDHPERVGMDRLAAAAAARRLGPPGEPVLVLDAGTAITVDLVGPNGDFQGGVILPGFRMIARALAAETDLLPSVGFSPREPPPPIIGKSTEGAIRSGLFWGAVGAVREAIRRIAEPSPRRPALYVAGGDARRLADHLDGPVRFVPHLVLMGVALAALTRPDAAAPPERAGPPED